MSSFQAEPRKLPGKLLWERPKGDQEGMEEVNIYLDLVCQELED